jgi:pilus assembly protein CpaE
MTLDNSNNVVGLPDGKTLGLSGANTKLPCLSIQLKALTICDSPETQRKLADYFSLIRNLDVEFSYTIPKPCNKFDLVILVADEFNNEIKRVFETLNSNKLPVLLVGDNVQNELIRCAMKANVQDIIPLSNIGAELINALQQISQTILNQKQVAPLISIINGKPGSGASFITGCLGEIYADVFSEDISLIDADLHYGSLADTLNLETKYYLGDALNDIDTLDSHAIKSMMSKRNNLNLLPSKAFSHLDDELQKKFANLEPLIWKIKQNYDLVLADLSRGLDVVTLPFIFLSTQIYIVVQQNIVSLREAKALIHQLVNVLGVNKQVIHVIVNRYSSKHNNIDVGDVKKVLAIETVFCVSNNYEFASSCTDLGASQAKLIENKAIRRDIYHIIEQIYPNKLNQQGNAFSQLLRRMHDFIR